MRPRPSPLFVPLPEAERDRAERLASIMMRSPSQSQIQSIIDRGAELVRTVAPTPEERTERYRALQSSVRDAMAEAGWPTSMFVAETWIDKDGAELLEREAAAQATIDAAIERERLAKQRSRDFWRMLDRAFFDYVAYCEAEAGRWRRLDAGGMRDD